MLKSILAFLLSLSLLLTLIACGSKDAPQETDSTPLSSAEDSAPSQEEIQSTADEPAESAGSTGSGITTQSEKEPESKKPSSASATAEAHTGSTEATASKSTAESKNEPANNVPVEVKSQAETMTSLASQETVSSKTQAEADIPSTVLSEIASIAYAPTFKFNGNSINELLQWVRTESSPPLAVQSDSKGGQKLVVPRLLRSDLEEYGISCVQQFDGDEYYEFNFQKKSSPGHSQNELFTVYIKPLSTQAQKLDLTKLWYENHEGIKTGTYKGITYAYIDGYEGTEKSDRIYASAWFVQDGYVITIGAYWANAFKPWNNEWFNYFDFETITL